MSLGYLIRNTCLLSAYYAALWGVETGWHKFQGFDRGTDKQTMTFDPNMQETGYYLNAVAIPWGSDLAYHQGITVASSRPGFKWAPMAELAYVHEHTHSTRDLIDPSELSATSDDLHLQGVTTDSYALAAGAASRYRIDDWQLTGAMLLGTAYDQTTVTYPDHRSAVPAHQGLRASIRGAAEYLWHGWVFGFNFGIFYTKAPLADGDLETTSGNAVIAVGTNSQRLKFW